MNYELRVNIFMRHELRVMSYSYCTSHQLLFVYELLSIAQVTNEFLQTTYELLFIARVTSYCLLLKLRVKFLYVIF